MNHLQTPQELLSPALTQLRAGRAGAAIPLLRAALARDPGYLPAVRALAAAHLAQNDSRAARRVLGEYVTNHPLCARGWRLAALLEWKLARRDDAVRLLRRGLELLPQSPLLRRQLDVLLGKPPASAQPATSAPDYLERVAQDSRLLRAMVNLPAHEHDTAMLRALESRLADLLRDQPAHPDRQLLLAKLQLRLGDLRAATRSVHRALRASPEYPQALRLKADLLARAGDYEQAVRTLESLVAKGHDWPDLHVQIAQWRHAKGQNDQARQHLYSALRLSPGYKRAQSLLRRCAA